jgi:hypothetical protein
MTLCQVVQIYEQSLFQTKHGNPNHFIIEGERGIGKSSLFLKACISSNRPVNIPGEMTLPGRNGFNFAIWNLGLATAKA